jgi:TonB family protein
MHMHRCGVLAHKAGGAWVLATGLGIAAITGAPTAWAQGAPSEAVQRQANSPYRFILQNANAPARTKPAPAPVPAPAAAPVEVKKAPRPEPVAVSRPVAVQPAATPAPEAAAATAPLPEALAAVPPLAEPPQPRLEVVPVQTDEPRLPAALLRERPSGVVRVAFDLNPDGSTSNVKVVGSTNRSLNRASVDAVSNWKFQPVDEVLTIETELAYKYD